MQNTICENMPTLAITGQLHFIDSDKIKPPTGQIIKL